MAFMHRVVRTHRPGLPWDFNFLSQVFGVRASGLHFWKPFHPGFSHRHPRRRCSDERREPAAVPIGGVGGRRLADPQAVFPPAPASLSEVFAPSAKHPTALAVAHHWKRSERHRKLFI